MRYVVSIVLLILIAVSSTSADDRIWELIQDGKIDEARRRLSEVSTAALRNGDNLFFQAMLEPNANRAANLFEVALNSSVDTRFREIIFLRLAQYYYITGRTRQLQKLIVDYRVSFEDGRFRQQVLRYSALVDEQKQAYESALRQADRYLMENSSGDAEQWGLIDKARVLSRNNKDIGADRMLRQLARKNSGPGVPQALYLLTADAIENRRADDAVFYYNLLREAYPSAVGLDALVDRLADVSSGPSRSESEAEQVTGTYYSVQVGVFSERDNAKRMQDRFEDYGWEVDISEKLISNIRYNVVYVGHFKSYNEAAAVKTKLEVEHNEVFQVVAR